MIRMKDFPSCFGENGVQVADSSSGNSKTASNSVTCVYRSQLGSHCYLISVVWSRSLIGQGLSICIDNSMQKSLCKVDIKQSLFLKRKGSKNIDINNTRGVIYWDLSSAKFGLGPEPTEGFYLGIVFDKDMVLLLGDLIREAYKRAGSVSPPNSTYVSRRENIFGKRVFSTRSHFFQNGRIHDIAIECEVIGSKDPSLSIRIDKKVVMHVKRLSWKFRGNQTILVDGLPIEVSWDVHSWLFNSIGSGIFMFQSCFSGEKSWSCGSGDPYVFPLTSSQSFSETGSQSRGFSLILYAWKNE